MVLTEREKLAYAIGTMAIAHWHNFRTYNYNETFFAYLDAVKPGVPKKEAIQMNNELKNFLEDLDYQLDKGMKKMIKDREASEN